jgi:hypothetical protein
MDVRVASATFRRMRGMPAAEGGGRGGATGEGERLGTKRQSGAPFARRVEAIGGCGGWRMHSAQHPTAHAPLMTAGEDRSEPTALKARQVYDPALSGMNTGTNSSEEVWLGIAMPSCIHW